MRQLNYNRLHYFWTVARLGGVTAASVELQVAQPTISAQIRALEEDLGEELFERTGRRLKLTEAGHVAFVHADEMFRLGDDLFAALKGRPVGGPVVMHCGISDFVPKPIARAVLDPVLRLKQPVRLVCVEWRLDQMLTELALHRLDVVLSDAAHPPTGGARVVSQVVAETKMGIYGVPALADRYRPGFPQSLDGAPFFLPSESQVLRQLMDNWCKASGVRPNVLGEFEDRALLKAFGQAGYGVFPASGAIEDNIRRMYGVERIGWMAGISQQFFALALQRKFDHPGVSHIFETARKARIDALA